MLPDGATAPLNADVYTALQVSREGEGGGTKFESITRRRDGANWEEANAEIKGIFALVANMVAQKTREIGIRMALGSTVDHAMVQIGRSGVGDQCWVLFWDWRFARECCE